MTDKEKQQLLTRKRKDESRRMGIDMRGKMDYCMYCNRSLELVFKCMHNDKDMEKNNCCVKAYRRMKRRTNGTNFSN